ncbi:MAG: hypothetical protein U0797_02560 [Gemmataceae bacterium]
MQTVHVRVLDRDTNKPTPVRIRFTDAKGTYFAPLGRLVEFPTGPGEEVGGQVRVGGRAWAYIDGACEVHLPPGQITVEICKGVEYTPILREVTLAAGQLALRFAIDHWIDPRRGGWHAGDMRAHELSPHAALVEGAGEGLAVVQVLARERPGVLRNLLAFSGTEAALRSAECLVVVNTLNEHPTLGTVGLLDSHRPVYPLRFGEPGPDEWSVTDWCDQCHRKRGLVVWPDLARLTESHPQGEALAALVLGKIDAYEVTDFPDPEPEVLGLYYRLLDAGARPALVGGSGKESNAVPLGAVRTYAQLLPGEELGPATWAKAVRAGRTFITNGPVLTLTASGAGTRPGRGGGSRPAGPPDGRGHLRGAVRVAGGAGRQRPDRLQAGLREPAVGADWKRTSPRNTVPGWRRGATPPSGSTPVRVSTPTPRPSGSTCPAGRCR